MINARRNSALSDARDDSFVRDTSGYCDLEHDLSDGVPGRVFRPRLGRDVVSSIRYFQLWMAAIAIMGYTMMTRSFAHIGVPPLYVAEVMLLSFLWTTPSTIFGPWFRSLTTPNALTPFAWMLWISIGYGALETARGLVSSPLYLTTLQNFVAHTYPLFLFIGIWVGRNSTNFLPRLIRVLSWTNGLYGVFYLIFFSRFAANIDVAAGEQMSGAVASPDVAWFGQPEGGGLVILGMLCYEKKLWRQWIPLALNTFLLMGMQMRAEWVGFTVGLIIWGILARELRRVFMVAATLVGLMAFTWIIDLRIPALAKPDTGTEISARNIIGRGLSAIDPKLGGKYTERADSAKATVDWRTGWWREIWKHTHQTQLRAAFGSGYGFYLWDLHPDGLVLPVRVPHNIFMYFLGYTGWVGVAIFYTLAACLIWALWKAFRIHHDPFALSLCGIFLLRSIFDVWVEVPYGAVPFYLIAGILVARVAPLYRSNTDRIASAA